MRVGLSSNEAASLVPNHGIWLDGPEATSTSIGARGYSYQPYQQSEGVAVDTCTVVLYVGGHTAIRRVIGDVVESREVHPGDVSLHPWSVVSRWSWRDPIEVLQVSLQPSYLQLLARELTGAPVRLSLRHQLRVDDAELTRLGADLVRELTPPRPLGAERGVRALGERMALHLLRHYFSIATVDEAERTLSVDECEAVRAFCEAHLDQHIDVARMAAVLHLGAHQFARAFRLSFESTPQAYLRERRLARARELLFDTALPLSEIAARTGFADQAHFTRLFKEQYGSPPARARRAVSQ